MIQIRLRGIKPEYSAYVNMLHRCYNEKHKQYKDYGGRGIRVCDEWRASFETFFTDLGKRPFPPSPNRKDEYQLDRIDNNGNYEKSNCKWSSRSEQMKNRNCVRFFYLNGAGHTLLEWSKIVNKEVFTIKYRIDHGWTLQDALFLPLQNKGKKTGPRPKMISGVP